MRRLTSRFPARILCVLVVLALSLAVRDVVAGEEHSTIGLTIYVGVPIAIVDLAFLGVDVYRASTDQAINPFYAIAEAVVGVGSIAFGTYLLAQDAGPTYLA